MRLMQISGGGGAEIVGRENAKKPRIDLRPHELEDFILGGLLLSLAQHLKFLIRSVPLPPH